MNTKPVYLEVTIYVAETDDVQDVVENIFLEATYDGRDIDISITEYSTANLKANTFLNTH